MAVLCPVDKDIRLDNVEVRIGDALSLPVESKSADFVISNGVLNLTPENTRRLVKCQVGFCDVAVKARFDCFRGTSKEGVAASPSHRYRSCLSTHSTPPSTVAALIPRFLPAVPAFEMW
jgi:hypothetical protein